MSVERGAPGVGTPGGAEEVQQIGVIGEQADCSSDMYDFQKELAAIDAALTRILGAEEAFADHRKGLVDYPHFGLTTETFRVDVTIRKRDGGTA